MDTLRIDCGLAWLIVEIPGFVSSGSRNVAADY
jgi:hypothetical protein